jgi:undecaprenyl-diphosphatase
VIAAGLAVAVTTVAPKLSVLALPLAVLVGVSRVALGVHYPHDVLTGLLLGAAAVGTLVLLIRTPIEHLPEAAGRAPRARSQLGA